MHLLVSLTKVNLFGSCSLALFDTTTHVYNWLSTTEYVDISSVKRALRFQNHIYILYKNSELKAKILCLDINLKIKYILDALELEAIVDIYHDENTLYALSNHVIYKVFAKDLELSFEPILNIEISKGKKVYKAATFDQSHFYAYTSKSLHDKNKFCIVSSLESVGNKKLSNNLGNVSEIVAIDDELYISDFESSLFIYGDKTIKINFDRGFVRGICKSDKNLWLCLNAWRYPTRKYAKRLSPEWVHRNNFKKSFSSQLLKLNESLEVIEEIDISHIGYEISSLIFLDDFQGDMSVIDMHHSMSKKYELENEKISLASNTEDADIR